ncbi:MAG: diguanylate cyclase [Candidatus Nanopelagicales bacterium]
MPSAVAEHLRRSSDAMLLLDDADVVVHATPAARTTLRTDHLVGLDARALARILGTTALDTDRSVPARVLSGRSASGEDLDVVVLPSDMGLCLFVAPSSASATTRPDPGAALIDKVLATVRDAVLVTIAEPIDAGGPVIVYANDALAHHTGYAVDDLLGRSPRILQGPSTDRAELDRLRASLEAWEPVTVELLNYRKDGTEFWVEIDIVPLADENGWFTHWVSVQRIITRRKRDETEREKRRVFVQAILDSLPAQTALLDLRGRIVAVNQPWRDFWIRGGDGTEPDWSTVSYLEVCRRSADHDEGQDGMDALAAYDGIRSVLSGETDEFTLDYMCPIDGVVHWFTLSARHVQHGVSGVVVSHTDITEHRNAESLMTYQALHDSLTGLPNRRLLHQRLGEQLLQDRAHDLRTAVVLLNVDAFKDVNDRYGTDAGNELLVELGRRLGAFVRDGDTVARLGADEFVVVLGRLPHTWSAEEFGDRLREALAAPYAEAGTPAPTASVGIATSPPHDVDADSILMAADVAMFASKQTGGDRCTVAGDPSR